MQVCTAMRTAAQRTPEAEEQEAVSNLVTVVDFQLSLPALDSEDDEVSAPLPVISLDVSLSAVSGRCLTADHIAEPGGIAIPPNGTVHSNGLLESFLN